MQRILTILVTILLTFGAISYTIKAAPQDINGDESTLDSINSEIFTQDDESEESSSIESALNPQSEAADTAKILHLEIATNLQDLNNQTLYIGQYISITYRIMLLNDAKIVHTEFNPSLDSKEANASVALIKSGEWVASGEYMTNTFTFKLLDSVSVIPSLVVHVQNNFTQDSMQTDSITLNAQSLVANPNYCGVIASSMQVTDVNIEENDATTNLVHLEIEATNSNLEDFRLPHIKEQEFAQGSIFGMDTARVNVVARVSKEAKSLEFSYFDIARHDFVPVSVNIANVPTFDEDVKEDLNPKSSWLKITNLAVLVLLAIFLLMTIIKRSYIFAALSLLLAGFLIYKIFVNTYSIKTLPNARVLILPTKNSTELLTIPNPTKLEAIDKKNNFYKVNIDSKTGWISKEDVR
ncbi:hypothetical protein DCO58_11440 [Helicobacter saguini]|uniref:SH3 domain-containing protein n=1 Tax=Helicobacter saguini TaxID=1548018 RepID=A0A347VQ35_9HELI|nr:SH3 domain-containing protein [Helicobacter saguini]MWV61096.1 hypothetical protein [Helicobacter saguini]MWV68235.1 hypothetical protein [Helicobacter saguini]MWV70301.1 hypothetical protein [Helicobacter saguini]MWV72203.1 hypothetical protein [Helicobacter saguini]TLD95256.1 hypothetical protein LS64_002540 [Helicobacter saguini]